jgi:hypothetical protein
MASCTNHDPVNGFLHQLLCEGKKKLKKNLNRSMASCTSLRREKNLNFYFEKSPGPAMTRTASLRRKKIEQKKTI